MRTRRDFLQSPPWRALLDSIPVLQRFTAGDPNAHGMSVLLQSARGYVDAAIAQAERGGPFVWYNLGFNPELIYALGDVCPVTIEGLGVMNNLLGSIDQTMGMIDTAQSKGVPADCCSADKLALGAIHQGCYPAPVCTIGINTPCDAQVLATQAMAELTGVPFFLIDVPYYRDESTHRHVAAQLGDACRFLEKHTGRKLDWDRLRHVCELSNQTTEAIWDWLEWRKSVPLAQSSKLVAFTLVIQVLFAGSEAGVSLARALLREARERTERGERFFEERARAVWYQDPVWTDMQIYDWFERDLGLTVPVDVFGFYAQVGLIDTRTPESMLHGLARKLVDCHPMGRQFRSDFDVYLRDFLHMHEAWRADCGIFAGHIACKHAWGGIGLFKEACRRADIPLLVFEFDMFDPRVTPYDDIYFEVARFVDEVVVPRKRRKGAA